MPDRHHTDTPGTSPGAEASAILSGRPVLGSSRHELVAAHAGAPGERVRQDMHRLLMWWLKQDPIHSQYYLDIYSSCVIRIEELFKTQPS